MLTYKFIAHLPISPVEKDGRRFLDTCLGSHDCTKGDDNGDHDVANATENLSCLWFHFFEFLSKFLFLFLVFVRSSVFVFVFVVT